MYQIDLERKLAVVTGGAGGIGRMVVRRLLDAGARVAIVDVSEEAMEKTRQEMEPYGTVGCFPLNLLDVDAMGACVENIRTEMGEISYLVQLAGILAGKKGLEITQEDWDKCLNIDARGLFFFMQQVVGKSMQKAGGSIVNIASMAAIRGMVPPIQGAHYGAAKAAVHAVTMQAAVEWADLGIRCNCIAPGGVKVGHMAGVAKEDMPKDMVKNIPMRDLVDPACIADTILYLLSDMSSCMTGQCLVIDGGSSVCGY